MRNHHRWRLSCWCHSFVITSRQFGVDTCLQCAFQRIVHGVFLESIMLFSSWSKDSLYPASRCRGTSGASWARRICFSNGSSSTRDNYPERSPSPVISSSSSSAGERLKFLYNCAFWTYCVLDTCCITWTLGLHGTRSVQICNLARSESDKSESKYL